MHACMSGLGGAAPPAWRGRPLPRHSRSPHPTTAFLSAACSATGLLEAGGYAALIYGIQMSGKGSVFNAYVAMQASRGRRAWRWACWIACWRACCGAALPVGLICW